MDKYHFNSLLLHLSNSSVEDAKTLLTLKTDYPYSQLLHALAARVSKDHGLSQQQAELQLAAVYANDRAVLKEIMTKDFADGQSSPVVRIEKSEMVAPGTQEVKLIPPHTEPKSTIDLADEVIHDLEKLHESKHKFEMLFLEGSISAPEHNVYESSSHTEDQSKGKSKKERIKELARALQNNTVQAEAGVSQKIETSSSRKKDGPVDSLIEEIKTTKEEIVPEGEKQKEQLQIIEQFIKIQPTIVNTKEKQAAVPPGDLSTIRSGEFGENIVSETLVEILLKQGKKDKAIEVLKKLIWKFPQKKAYFAAQIEELKK